MSNRTPDKMSIVFKHVVFLVCLGAFTRVPFACAELQRFSIMLDPAGDAQHPGRKLDDSLERGVTLQYAESLKKELESRYPTVRVVLTRWPGETVEELQNANFANRLHIDWYVNINFYQEKGVKPKLFFYCFSYGHDFFLPNQSALSFVPYECAYQENSKKSRMWATKVKNALQAGSYKNNFDIKKIMTFPFKPLIGIKAPAMGVEVGLKNKDDWRLLVQALADSMASVIEAAISGVNV